MNEVTAILPPDPGPGLADMSHPERRTALDQRSLLAEVNLLMDFVSGRPELGLDGGKTGRLPCSMTYDQALTHFFAMRDQRTIAGEDLHFLVGLRDYLNSAAFPASGRTVAFSTLVTREAAPSQKATCDAVCAYPEYDTLAAELRRFMRWLQRMSIVMTLIVAGLAAYVFACNLIVTRITDLSAQLTVLDSDIEKEEMAFKPPDGEYHRICHGEGGAGYPSPRALHLCAHAGDLLTKLNNSYRDLKNWVGLGRSSANKMTEQNAGAILAVLNGYVIPLLMGFLGSAAYVLRLYLKNLGERLLTPRDQRSNTVRIVLGMLSGLTIGFFLSPAPTVSQGTAGLGMSLNLTAPALGFIAGYAVDVLFKFLDNLADTVFLKK